MVVDTPHGSSRGILARQIGYLASVSSLGLPDRENSLSSVYIGVGDMTVDLMPGSPDSMLSCPTSNHDRRCQFPNGNTVRHSGMWSVVEANGNLVVVDTGLEAVVQVDRRSGDRIIVSQTMASR